MDTCVQCGALVADAEGCEIMEWDEDGKDVGLVVLCSEDCTLDRAEERGLALYEVSEH